jgi:hypothetical protein
MMQDDSAHILDDLLIRWWNWKAPIQPARGYGRTSLGFESYRTSRQHDDINGALYDDEEAAIMRAVEREVNALESVHRMVIYLLARALTVGATVFCSPRLNKEERDQAVRLARNAITFRLISAGVM